MSAFAAALPHGPLTAIADGVFVVRGGFQMGPGIKISRTMTVVKEQDGLVLLNAIRLTDAALAELDALGKVKHLVKLSDSHGVDEPFYVDRYAPTVWGLERGRPDRVKSTRTLGPDGPIGGGKIIDHLQAKGWREASYWLPRSGGTLVTCDVLQNHADTEGASLIGRWMMSILGFKGGVIVAPMWRRFQKLQGAELRAALSDLAGLELENLVTGHGPAVVGGAQAMVQRAIEDASS